MKQIYILLIVLLVSSVMVYADDCSCCEDVHDSAWGRDMAIVSAVSRELTVRDEYLEDNEPAYLKDETGGGIGSYELFEYLGFGDLTRKVGQTLKDVLDLYFVPRTEFEQRMDRVQAQVNFFESHLGIPMDETEIDLQAALITSDRTGEPVIVNEHNCYKGYCIKVS